MKDTVLKLKGISKSFPGVKALQDMDFDLKKGEVHCIVGGNGAGKSTLIKILSGLHAPDCGEITYEDERCFEKLTPGLSHELGIQTIYQETMLAQTLSVAENIFLGDNIPTQNGKVNWKGMREKAREILRKLEVDIDPKDRVETLGIAGKQTVQIAKAFARKATVMIFDEPTASYGKKEVENLFRIIESLKESGVGVIYISHRLDEVFRIADRVSVLKDGKKVSEHDIEEVTIDQMIKEMVGRATNQFYKRHESHVGDVILKAEGICGDGVHNASFELKSGEVLGFAGMVGSKRTELLRLLFGAGNIEGGKLYYKGKTFVPKSPLQMIKKGFCMITEDRAITGLMTRRNVRENIMICDYNKSNTMLINYRKEKARTKEQCKILSVKASSIEQTVENLSGGNQQKVILAKWFLTNGEVFILDEPTRGIDIGAKEEIYKLIEEIIKSGKSVILVSSELPELISLSDRLVVMHDGCVVGEIEGKEASEENILKLVVGG